MDCFFFLLASISYVKEHYRASFSFFVFSLLSKPAAIMFPFLILFYEWGRGKKVGRTLILRAIPFFLISAVIAGWTIWEQTAHSGAQGEAWEISFLGRILIAGKAFWFYLAKLIWPTNLSFIYPRWAIDSGDLISYLWPLLGLALVLGTYFFRFRGSRAAFLALGYYVLMLFPVLGSFNVYFFRYSFVADHFQYLAAIGPIVLISGFLWRFKRIGILILPVLWVLTFNGSLRFRNQETLWRSTIKSSPSSWLAHNNLANLLMKQGKVNEAIHYYEQAVFYKPDFVEAHSNFGVALTHAGQFERAIKHLNLALRHQPDFSEARSNLERAFFQLKRTVPST
jgi:tetratricopeptide (TPR) repeat protein